MDNQTDTIARPPNKYFNKDDFKTALETKIGHYIDINLWLQARPRKPFPWTNIDLEESFIYIRKAEQGMWITKSRLL